jgi:hypothetical protein
MISVSKHCITIDPTLFDVLLGYTNHYIGECRTRLEEYKGVEEQPDQQLVTTVEREIARAETVARNLVTLRDRLEQIYIWNFRQLAEAFRKSTSHLDIADVQSIPELNLVLFYVMEMLKEENPHFSREKFINYINNGKETYDHTSR